MICSYRFSRYFIAASLSLNTVVFSFKILIARQNVKTIKIDPVINVKKELSRLTYTHKPNEAKVNKSLETLRAIDSFGTKVIDTFDSAMSFNFAFIINPPKNLFSTQPKSLQILYESAQIPIHDFLLNRH